MDWTELLMRKEPILSIYGSAPSLDGARIHEIRIDRDGSFISVRFDFSRFPDDPPRKWRDANYNRTQVTLMLVDIKKFTANGWLANPIGDISIEKHEGGVRLVIASGLELIECIAGFVNVEKISGYCAKCE